MLITLKIKHIHTAYQTRRLMRWSMANKPNLHDAYEWEKDIYVKTKQDDKLANQATRAKWIGHSSQSDGHLIHWPNRHNISVERNIIFDTGEQVKLSPTPPTDESEVPTTKKLMVVPPIALQVPSIPACDPLSQQGGKGRIEEIVEPGPEQELEDLQLSQRPIIGPSEQPQPRRSEEFIFNTKNLFPVGQLQDLKPEKTPENYSSVLAYEVIEDHQLETSGMSPSQEKQESDYNF